jgi:hypothetical protein
LGNRSISVNYLRQKFNGDNIGVFCVFCNFKEEQLQTINNLLASIWAQSMNTQPSISEAAKSCYTSKHKNKERPDRKDIQELVKAEIGRYSRVFIIVDALDECSDKGNERNVLLTELQNLLSLPIDVQLLFTSRLSINILPHFPSCKTMVISARDEDIKHYVRSRLDQLHDFVQRDKILQEEIVGGM